MVDSIKILKDGKPALEMRFEPIEGGGRRLKYDAHVGPLEVVMTLLAAMFKVLADGEGDVVINLDSNDPSFN